MFSYSRTSHKWNHTKCACFILQHNVFKFIHVACVMHGFLFFIDRDWHTLMSNNMMFWFIHILSNDQHSIISISVTLSYVKCFHLFGRQSKCNTKRDLPFIELSKCLQKPRQYPSVRCCIPFQVSHMHSNSQYWIITCCLPLYTFVESSSQKLKPEIRTRNSSVELDILIVILSTPSEQQF